MRFCFVLLFSSVLTSLGISAPPDVPQALKVKPGQVVAVTVKMDKKIGVAKNFGVTDAFFGELVAPAGQRQFMFQAPLPEADGTYKGKAQYVISWWTEGELEGTSTTITIDSVPVVPPKPVPPPVPPTPADPLLSVLQLAYTAESSPTKAADVISLAAVLRAVATAVANEAVKTADDHYTLLHNSTEARIGTRLKEKLRPAIGAELNRILPNGPGKGSTPLTTQNRTDVAALYLRIADLLEKVK